MDTAFNKETKRLVKAWAINRDTSYIKPEDDLFLVNKDEEEIENYQEVLSKNNIEEIEVRYRRGHDRILQNGKIVGVKPHFFIPNKEKLGIKSSPESPEHKKIKSFMYDYFYDNEELVLPYSKYVRKNEEIIKYVKIKDLDIDWQNFTLKKEDFFEINLTDTFNTRRVDLFLPFNEYSCQFGHGLVIEVQLSNQRHEKIKERTIDRALKGYSTIWIMKNDFEDVSSDNLVLKKSIHLNSWQAVLHNNADNIADNIYNKIKKYSREFDNKVEITRKIFGDLVLREGLLCPKCKEGQLLKRKGAFGFFLGCSLYPDCNASYKIIDKELD